MGPWLPVERTANTLIILADVQADLSLRWAHKSFGWFCHVRLINKTGYFNDCYNYAPNFEEVDGPYWFRVVRACVRGCVRASIRRKPCMIGF